MHRAHLDAAQCYARFTSLRLALRPTFQGCAKFSSGQGSCWRESPLPAIVQATIGDYVCIPSVMDAALQATLCMSLGSQSTLMLPFALGSLEIMAPCAAHVGHRAPSDGVVTDGHRAATGHRSVR
jgi:hypothetical protein